MKSLFIRDMPPDLMKKIKMVSAMQEKTMKDFVIAAITTALEGLVENGK